jgi:hypothetical protein
LKENVVGVVDGLDDNVSGDTRMGNLRKQRSATGALLGTTGTVANRRASAKRASSSKNLVSPALAGLMDASGGPVSTNTNTNGGGTADSTPPAPLQRRGSNVGLVPLERRGSNAGLVPLERRGSAVSGGLGLIRGKCEWVVVDVLLHLCVCVSVCLLLTPFYFVIL